MYKQAWIIIFLLLAKSAVAQTGFSVASLLQNDMVIQQDRLMKIWGNGTAGDSVYIKGDWMSKPVLAVTDPQQEWSGNIIVPKAVPGRALPHMITIVCKNTTVQLKNILIGEVWLCSGQSNMDMELRPFIPWLKGVLDYEKEIAAANYPNMRVLNIETEFRAVPAKECRGNWKICTPQNAAEFSGVAYYFGRELMKTLNVPVGLVVSSLGGSACEAWMSRQALESDSILKKKYLYPYDTSLRAKEPLDNSVTFEKVVRPTLLYNGMIQPLTSLSIRGALWYQGESNKDDKAMYTRLCGALVKDWRLQFGMEDMPFYYVQMTPYSWLTKDSLASWYAELREAQEAMLVLKNTGMAVTMDIGDPDDIHPRDKRSVGIRLCKLALAHTYNIKGIQDIGPRFLNYTIDNKVVKINFTKESIGAGLNTKDGLPPQHFYVAGPDKIFYKADAKIVGNQVWLTCDKVAWTVAVRYAFTNYPMTSLQNKEGQPAWPFRTDRW